MKFSLALSTDRKLCKMSIEQPPKPNESLTPKDLESLISNFAAQRQQMIPAVAEGEDLQSHGAVPVDASSPKLDFALLQQETPLVVLAIAFPGLGWRNVSMTLAESESLGRQLLALSAQATSRPQ